MGTDILKRQRNSFPDYRRNHHLTSYFSKVSTLFRGGYPTPTPNPPLASLLHPHHVSNSVFSHSFYFHPCIFTVCIMIMCGLSRFSNFTMCIIIMCGLPHFSIFTVCIIIMYGFPQKYLRLSLLTHIMLLNFHFY